MLLVYTHQLQYWPKVGQSVVPTPGWAIVMSVAIACTYTQQDMNSLTLMSSFELFMQIHGMSPQFFLSRAAFLSIQEALARAGCWDPGYFDSLITTRRTNPVDGFLPADQTLEENQTLYYHSLERSF